MGTFQDTNFNASIHTSSATSRWFSEKHIEVLEGPSCSPDLKPMQNHWGILARGIYAKNRQFQSQDELKTAILNAWCKIDAKTTSNPLQSMHNRIFRLIQRNGNVIGY